MRGLDPLVDAAAAFQRDDGTLESFREGWLEAVRVVQAVFEWVFGKPIGGRSVDRGKDNR